MFTIAISAVYCSVTLQIAARKVRRNALEHLQHRRIQELPSEADGGDADPIAAKTRIEQIDSLIQNITELKSGAFRSWHQQPIIKAFLLLLSSASIFAIDMLGGG